MGVKLRVRVDGASHRIEVPEVCTLGQLRAAVASKVLADAWPASAVGLSLNGDASADLGDATGASESATDPGPRKATVMATLTSAAWPSTRHPARPASMI